jgi:hypothetical protein
MRDFDRSKLSPAPWHARPNENDDWGCLRDANGDYIANMAASGLYMEFADKTPWGPERMAGPPTVAANLGLTALGRNAWDAMQRRGIAPVPLYRGKEMWWCVRLLNGSDMPLRFSVENDHRGWFRCPFEAVCVADEWLTKVDAELLEAGL